MGQNILITGAAGYIGGSVLANFIAQTSGPIKGTTISAAVRSNEQVQRLSKLGVNVIQLDLTDEKAVHQAVNQNEIDIVVHTATATDEKLVSSLIKGLGQRRKTTGGNVYFLHSSVITVYAEEASWPYGEIKDSDAIYEKEKEMGGPHPIRTTNVLITEESKAQGVTSFNIVVPTVYGRGTGEWRKLSVSIPAYIRDSVAQKIVYKFDKDGHPPATHISDLVELYTLIVSKALQNSPIPSGENGYYFAMAHRIPWWTTMDRIASALHARGLVEQPTPQVWPSDEMAAEKLGFPVLYIRAMGTATGKQIPVNAYQIGWQPQWDEKRYLESIDDEVQAALELDDVKQSVFDSLIATGK